MAFEMKPNNNEKKILDLHVIIIVFDEHSFQRNGIRFKQITIRAASWLTTAIQGSAKSSCHHCCTTTNRYFHCGLALSQVNFQNKSILLYLGHTFLTAFNSFHYYFKNYTEKSFRLNFNSKNLQCDLNKPLSVMS